METSINTSSIIGDSPLEAISIGRLTGRPRVANLTGGAVVDSALNVIMVNRMEMVNIVLSCYEQLKNNNFEIVHLADPRRDVSTD